MLDYLMNEPKAKRGRPRNELAYTVAQAFSRPVRQTREEQVSGAFRAIGGEQAQDLPAKVSAELGRLLIAEPGGLDIGLDVGLLEANGQHEAAQAKRAELFRARPELMEALKKAIELRAKGWNAQTITALFRQERLEAYQIRSRNDWADKYHHALEAVYQLAQQRAATLAGPEASVKQLSAKLLADALEAAQKEL
jgi:hypothetical protein